MTKVAIYVPSLRGGGAERVMVTLANKVSSAGYPVDLLLVEANGPYLNELTPEINIVNFKCRSVAKSLFKLAFYLLKSKPAVVYSTMRHANIIAIIAKMISRSRAELVVREANTIAVAVKNDEGVKERLLPTLMKVFYPYADKIIAVSFGVKSDLVSYVGIAENKIEVIYNPVVGDKLYADAVVPVDHIWLQEKDCQIILAAGRLEIQKNYECLIEAFSMICGEHKVKLIIIGEGSQRRYLESLINKKGLGDLIDLPGFQENSRSYINRADLFVVSSLWEGLPNGLIEALALGIKIVSTDCPSGPSEILDDGRWGSLVPVSDPGKMADAMSMLLAMDKTDIKQVREYSFEKFGVESAIDKYLCVASAL